jgi:hypothetical protein
MQKANFSRGAKESTFHKNLNLFKCKCLAASICLAKKKKSPHWPVKLIAADPKRKSLLYTKQSGGGSSGIAEFLHNFFLLNHFPYFLLLPETHKFT